MRLFEILTPYLVIALTVAAGVCGVLCARVELRLAARHKVTLEEYRQKNYLFYIGRDLPLCIVTGIVALATLALLVACLISPVIRIYAIALFFLLAVNATVIYLSLSRAKCARDVRVFDLYYVKVENLLSNKARTLANIDACRRRTGELQAKLEETLAAFNRHLSNPIPGDFVGELFLPPQQTIAEYLAEIDRFSLMIEADFSAALIEFLRTNEQPELRTVPFRSFNSYVVDDLLDEIKSSYGTRIARDVVVEAERGAVKSAQGLGEIMELLHRLEVTVEEETFAKFLTVASRFDDREKLVSLLYRNHQISAATVCDRFVSEGWDWAFVPSMAGVFNRRELGTILDTLLEKDRAEMTFRLLSGLDLERLDLLDLALQRAAEKQNGATVMAGACRLLLSHQFAVGNRASLAETLALFLFEHQNEVMLPKEELTRIAEIVQSRRFGENTTELCKLYATATSRAEPLARSTKRILLQYLIDMPDDFLSGERLAALFNEYSFTLSFGDFSLMRSLLAAWLLQYGSAESRAVVRREIKTLAAAKIKSDAAAEDAALAKLIFINLAKGNRMHLCALIYRTEIERETLDRVLALGKEEA